MGSIVEALEALGGEAHHQDIANYVVEHGEEPFPADPAASVRARLQERCSDYTAYKGLADMFESEQGSGVWRFRTTRKPDTLSDNAADSTFTHQPEMDAFVAQEGGIVPALHYRRERNPQLIKAFKANLDDCRCAACGMSFDEIYGDIANGFIEAHHLKPVAEMSDGETTSLDDLAPLCANCHRVVHKNGLMPVSDLAERLSQAGGHADQLAATRKQRSDWKQATLLAIERLVQRGGNKEFSRQQIIEEELAQIVADVQSKGETPEQTLSRVLQELRNEGWIQFLGNSGQYRATDNC